SPPSLHDALPIWAQPCAREAGRATAVAACPAPRIRASDERRTPRVGVETARGHARFRGTAVSYSLISFDWDGTLIDSAGTIVQCIQQASADLGLEVPHQERARHVIGLGL